MSRLKSPKDDDDDYYRFIGNNTNNNFEKKFYFEIKIKIFWNFIIILKTENYNQFEI